MPVYTDKDLARQTQKQDLFKYCGIMFSLLAAVFGILSAYSGHRRQRMIDAARVLNNDERAKLIAVLSKRPTRVTIKCFEGVVELTNFAKQIADVFRSAHWDVGDGLIIYTPMTEEIHEGLHLSKARTYDNDKDEQTIVGAFRQIDVDLLRGSHAAMPNEAPLVLTVGVKHR